MRKFHQLIIIEGLDIPTYSTLKKEFLNEHHQIHEFLRNLDSSLKKLNMFSEGDVKKILTPEYIVDVFLKYCAARENARLPPKKKCLIVGITICFNVTVSLLGVAKLLMKLLSF